MAEYLLQQASLQIWARGEIQLEDNCVRALQAYSWLGNIRELRNVIESFCSASRNRLD